MPVFIQGFLARLQLGAADITLTVESFDFSEKYTSLDKSVMDGSGESKSIEGKKSGSLSITGHIAQAEWNTIMAVVDAAEDTVFEFNPVGDGGTDFQYVGFLTITDLSVSVSASGNWGFSLSGDTFGVVYSPHVPAA